MQLLKPSVYKALQKKVRGYTTVEDALQKIRSDADLHRIIKDYAKKHHIHNFGQGYFGIGPGVTLRNQIYAMVRGTSKGRVETALIFWESGEPQPAYAQDEDEKIFVSGQLYLGPDPTKEVMPILLRVYRGMTPTHDMFGRDNYEITKDNKLWAASSIIGSCYQLDKRHILETPFFANVSAKDILNGLEQAVAKFLK